MTTILGASSTIAPAPSRQTKQPHQSWLSLLLIGLTTLSPTTSALAQPIAPANDGTGTLIAPNGNQFDISGGTQAGGNLFHSFQQFGLDTNQIANFLATPDLQNILSRVVGGDPSIINGIIQVTGGTPNLYLLNPAGIVFGQNASLNVPASFTATTATGIQIGAWEGGGDGMMGGWFNAYGTNNYATLIGTPNAFLFSSPTSATLINAGTLTVKPGQSLNLIGGTVINTGTLTAPGGSITVLSVPGSSLVRLSQPGSLLSLEILPPTSPASSSPTPLTLPQLLTGSGLSAEATGLSVDADGTVRLVATNTVIPQTAGTTIVSGTIDTSTIPTPHTLHPTPYIAVLGDRVALLAASLNADGTNGGGTILVGGDYQGNGQIPNAQFTTVDATSTLSANALQSGNGGKIILWADNITRFFGTITARGASTLPNTELLTPNSAPSNGGFAEVSGKQHLIFAGTADLTAPNGNAGTLLLDPTNILINNVGPDSAGVASALPDIGGLSGDVTISQATLQALPGNTNIVLQATGNITLGDLDIIFMAATESSPGLSFQAGTGSVTFKAGGAFTMNSSHALQAQGRNLTIEAASISMGQLLTRQFSGLSAGSVTLTATNGGVTIANAGIDTVSLGIAATPGNAGDISITAEGANGFVTLTGRYRAFSQTGSGGSVNVRTTGDITILCPLVNACGIETFSQFPDSFTTVVNVPVESGSVSLISHQGSIDLNSGNIGAYNIFNGRSGSIQLSARGDIVSNGLIATQTDFDNSAQPNIDTSNVISGAIEITSREGIVSIDGAVSTTSLSGRSGQIIINAAGNLTTGDVSSGSALGSERIQIITQNGSITTGNVISKSTAVDAGGNIELRSPNSLTVGGINTNGTTSSGLITLDGAEINLVGDAGSIQSQGNPLVIQPKTASQNLVLGGAEGTDASTLYFSTRDLAALATTFSGLTFGRSDGTGTVTVDSSGITLNSPSVIQTGSGSILLNGNISTPSQPLTVTGAMQLGNDVTLTTAATGAGNTLTLNGNLAGQNRLLNLATGSSTLVVNGLLGSESPLSSIGLTTASLLLNGGINTNATLAPTVPITLTGNIALISQTGNVDLRNAPITSQTAGSGVTVTSQQGNILANDISTATATTGGAINLLAPNGSVTAGNLGTSGQTGGAVFVQASDSNLNPDGAVGLRSTPSISLGQVNTSGSVGNGGSVTLDPLNAVEVSFINAQGGPSGVGGDVTITTGGSFFIARGTFLDQNGLNASISTAGGLGGGDITITHNGGDLFFPFNTALTDATIFGSFPSGTAGVLTTGADNLIQNRAFPGSYTQPGGSGTIRIITSNRFETAILNSLPDGIEPENLLTIDAERPFPIEEYFTREFEAYFAEAFGITPSFDTPIKSLEQIQDELSQVERATGIKPAILYIAFFPQGQTGKILAPISEVQLLKRLEDPTDQLDLVLVTSNHPPIYRRVTGATREKVSMLVDEFRQNYVISPSGRKSTDYVPNVQQFYQWLVAPIQTDLQALKIQNLTFITDVKLRSLPIATLHDGKDFIIRNYSVGFMPSMSLTNTQYADIKNSRVLAMGASDFSLSGLFLSAKGEAKARSPLPAVPLELELITTVWQGAMFLNEQFTRETLERERRDPAYRIIHLATHAQFESGSPERSFIQLWAKSRLRLDTLRELRWYDPVVEMLVLSACETAVGDRNAELGFIGLATQAGVKTAVGSFWTVDDAGSSALMSEFYWQLKSPDVPIKAEAIRQAQLAMIEGRVKLENGQLVYSGGRVNLPPAIGASTVDFSHPYFWSAFTTVGSPW